MTWTWSRGYYRELNNVSDLFQATPQRIPLVGGELIYYPAFFDCVAADQLFAMLRNKVTWRQDRIRMAGREIPIPRLNAWYGDTGTDYRYSGIHLRPRSWFDELQAIRDRIAAVADAPFNSALLNLYRNGSDSVSWHADDEPELGASPVIAAVSLGVERRFQLKSRHRQPYRFQLRLAHGSLLIMAGDTQRNWRHQVPKEPAVNGERINITFRYIHIV